MTGKHSICDAGVAQHAHTARPPSARKIVRILALFYEARLRRRPMRRPLGGQTAAAFAACDRPRGILEKAVCWLATAVAPDRPTKETNQRHRYGRFEPEKVLYLASPAQEAGCFVVSRLTRPLGRQRSVAVSDEAPVTVGQETRVIWERS